MLPLARFQTAGVLGAVINAVELENPNNELGTAEESAHLAVSLLLVATSFAFLVPANAALSLGRLWHAGVFALMAAVCTIYHVCDTELLQTLDGGTGCPSAVRHTLTLADHGWAYYCALQMAFLVLGPEDPVMQWIDHPVVRDTPACALAMSPPRDVMAVTRVLPAVAMAAFLCLYTSWADFHWQCVLLQDVLLLFGFLAFWLHQDRRTSMPKVLIRLRFWRRIWNHCIMPMLLASFAFIAMESADSRAMHAVWHLIAAALAVSIIKTVNSRSMDVPKAEAEELMEMSARNPIVVHVLLGSVALFGLPTLFACLTLDCWATGQWRWALVSMPTMQRPGGYVAAIGGLPTLLAMSGAFWLIRSTTMVSHQYEPEEIVASKEWGCLIGYGSVAFGFFAIAANGSMFPVLHLWCLVASLGLLLVAMTLTTLSVRYPLAPGNRARCLLTVATVVVVSGFIMLLVLAHQYVPNDYGISHPLLAISEYLALALPTLWPLTWSSEVQARWQTGKGVRWMGQLT